MDQTTIPRRSINNVSTCCRMRRRKGAVTSIVFFIIFMQRTPDFGCMPLTLFARRVSAGVGSPKGEREGGRVELFLREETLLERYPASGMPFLESRQELVRSEFETRAIEEPYADRKVHRELL